MFENKTSYALEILRQSKSILLIDWPNPEVPRTLLNASFTAFCYSPNGYTKPEVVADYPQDVNQKNIFPPKNKEDGYLIFRPLNDAPGSVDIVSVYRPEEEHAKIITNQVLPLGAKCLWLQPPVTSDNTRVIAESQGLIFIQGSDIATIAVQLSSQE
jgi:predicted CoA-binding protein